MGANFNKAFVHMEIVLFMYNTSFFMSHNTHQSMLKIYRFNLASPYTIFKMRSLQICVVAINLFGIWVAMFLD